MICECDHDKETEHSEGRYNCLRYKCPCRHARPKGHPAACRCVHCKECVDFLRSSPNEHKWIEDPPPSTQRLWAI